MKTNKKKEPLLSPVLRWFMFAMVLAKSSAVMSSMLFALHLDNLGADVTQIGLVFTIISVVSLVLQVFGGWISDSIGRLKAVAIGSIVGVIGSFAIIFAPNWQLFTIAIILGEFPYTLIGPSFHAFIAENSKEENRGRVFGVSEMLLTVSNVLAPLIGGFLSRQFSFSLVFWAAAIIYSTAAMVRLWMLRTMKSAKVEEVKKLTGKSFGTSVRILITMILGGGIITWIFLTDGVRDAAFSLSRNLEILYLEEMIGFDTAQIGLLLSISSIPRLLMPLVAGKLGDKYGERVPISAGFLMIFCAYALLLTSYNFIPFIIVWAFFGLGNGLLSPAYASLVSKVVPHDKLGIFNGMFYGAIGLIALPAPFLGSLMWEKINPISPFMVAAVVSLLIIFPIWFKFKLPKKEEKGKSQGEATAIAEAAE
ncbi:MAG: MFS transporter [Anaerolineae bacterium]|jgi:MFS family permease|nr:MFS transporter [Anaerolineae bacterium]